jgi:hypothetical protein
MSASVNGVCDDRIVCHITDSQCKQYPGDVSLICPSNKTFAILCYAAIENPDSIQCVPSSGEDDAGTNSIWCCE